MGRSECGFDQFDGSGDRSWPRSSWDRWGRSRFRYVAALAVVLLADGEVSDLRGASSVSEKGEPGGDQPGTADADRESCRRARDHPPAGVGLWGRRSAGTRVRCPWARTAARMSAASISDVCGGTIRMVRSLREPRTW